MDPGVESTSYVHVSCLRVDDERRRACVLGHPAGRLLLVWSWYIAQGSEIEASRLRQSTDATTVL
ncbi:hypothetical protein M406DRAFT_57242, partial [Cryphonectria parasitica EP155]